MRSYCVRTRVIACMLLALIAVLSADDNHVRGQALNVRWDFKNSVGASAFLNGRSLGERGAGQSLYLIGSHDNTDDQDNICSMSPYSKNGVMRPFNGASAPTLPYSMAMSRASSDPSILYFQLSLGKNPQNLKVLDWPFDGLKDDFTYFRFEGSQALHSYSQIADSYTAPGLPGPTGVFIAPGEPKWGEAIGPEVTVRVTMTSASRPISLAFVNAPFLGHGVRNVEFGCANGLRKNEKATFAGQIQVLPTSLPMQAQTFQSEVPHFHQLGKKDGTAWSVRESEGPGYAIYGPYTSSIQIGKRRALFRILVDRTSRPEEKVATVDVFDSAQGQTVAKRDIYRGEFAGRNAYQYFSVPFIARAGQRLEFRTYVYKAAMKQDFVRVE